MLLYHLSHYIHETKNKLYKQLSLIKYYLQIWFLLSLLNITYRFRFHSICIYIYISNAGAIPDRSRLRGKPAHNLLQGSIYLLLLEKDCVSSRPASAYGSTYPTLLIRGLCLLLSCLHHVFSSTVCYRNSGMVSLSEAANVPNHAYMVLRYR